MTDLLSTVRVMFVGDPAGLVTAYEDSPPGWSLA